MMRPILVVNPAVKNKSIEDVALEDFEVVGYFHHGVLKGKMAV
jgi:thymidylate synthase